MGDFFFSSRRRHTRYWRDWSSDVCSSDLISSCRACFPDGPWDAATLERILTLAGGFGYLAWQEDIPVGFILARDLAGEVRSEERRVGKEGRSSWGRYKQNMKLDTGTQ